MARIVNKYPLQEALPAAYSAALLECHQLIVTLQHSYVLVALSTATAVIELEHSCRC